MSAFTGPLTITHLDADWRRWRLEQPLRYEVGELGSGRVIEAPVGFTTDGTSVPRLLWVILPTWGSYSRAAVIHDVLLGHLKVGKPHPEAPTRWRADRIMWEAMGVCGTPLPLRCLVFLGVTAGTLLSRF